MKRDIQEAHCPSCGVIAKDEFFRQELPNHKRIIQFYECENVDCVVGAFAILFEPSWVEVRYSARPKLRTRRAVANMNSSHDCPYCGALCDDVGLSFSEHGIGPLYIELEHPILDTEVPCGVDKFFLELDATQTLGSDFSREDAQKLVHANEALFPSYRRWLQDEGPSAGELEERVLRNPSSFEAREYQMEKQTKELMEDKVEAVAKNFGLE